MFTGLVEEMGRIAAVQAIGNGLRFTIAAEYVMDDLTIDASIAVNGVCQTVVSHNSNTFDVIAVEETLKKTTLGNIRTGKKVNLERAMKLSDRLGGHLVQGHVDTCGTVIYLETKSTSHLLTIRFPAEFSRYLIPVGSICMDGISLTCARVEQDTFTVAIIPHTWSKTTIHELRVGSQVNLEFDVLGKYIEKMLQSGTQPLTAGLSKKSLEAMGYE